MRSRKPTALWHGLGRVARGRRRLTALLTVLAVLALGSGASSAAPAQGAPGILPEGDWPEPAATWATEFIQRAERELPAYGDTESLGELGFVDIGPIAPGGYRHFVNVSWFTDAHILNPQYPESLVFQRTSTGGWRLVAAMFFLWPSATMETIPEMIRWIPGWHTHPELCSDNQGRVVGAARPDGTCARGNPVLTPMMHAWIVDNDCGHRFGGVDAGGLHCHYDHDDHDDHGGGGDHDDHDDDDDHGDHDH